MLFCFRTVHVDMLVQPPSSPGSLTSPGSRASDVALSVHMGVKMDKYMAQYGELREEAFLEWYMDSLVEGDEYNLLDSVDSQQELEELMDRIRKTIGGLLNSV